MSVRRFMLVVAALFVTSLAWNAAVHLVVLRGVNASVQHLRRPDLVAKAPLSLLLTAALMFTVVWGYSRFVPDRTLSGGLRYGLFLAVLAGLLVDLNQYILFPLPGSVVLCWFVGGLLEFLLYGALLTRLVPANRSPR